MIDLRPLPRAVAPRYEFKRHVIAWLRDQHPEFHRLLTSEAYRDFQAFDMRSNMMWADDGVIYAEIIAQSAPAYDASAHSHDRRIADVLRKCFGYVKLTWLYGGGEGLHIHIVHRYGLARVYRFGSFMPDEVPHKLTPTGFEDAFYSARLDVLTDLI